MLPFAFFEIVAYVVPGLILMLLGFLLIDPAKYPAGLEMGDIGKAGAAFLACYVLGELLAALGNQYEKLVRWLLGGKPGHWVWLGKGTKLLHADQIARLQNVVGSILNRASFTFAKTQVGPKSWDAVFHELYYVAARAKMTHRTELFSGLSDMFRGLATAFLLGAMFYPALLALDGNDCPSLFPLGAILRPSLSRSFCWPLEVTLVILFVASTYRMHRFEWRYYREGFIAALAACQQVPCEGAGKEGTVSVPASSPQVVLEPSTSTPLD
ncbi:MAG: hypothetical protein HY719_13325 [Planctomycetes bacterium]|nr:hypothetical protein [Planctomycetota bacterium]